METVVLIRNESGGLTDHSGRFRKYSLDVPEQAEEAQPLNGTIVIDDPDGTFDVVGHRQVRILEMAATYPYLFIGYTGRQTIRRGPYRTGVSRQWELELADLNTVLSRRVQVGSDANRPAETDVQRMTWLFGTAEAELIDDTSMLWPDDPVDLDAADLRDWTSDAIIRDTIEHSGKNCYLTHLIDGADPIEDMKFAIWYGHGTLEEYDSPVKISNILSDIDMGASPREVFEASLDSELVRDPTRLVSGVLLNYDGARIYRQREATATAFARRDSVYSAPGVKTAAKGTARANRILADNSTQDHVITTTIHVPPAQADAVRPGQRVEARFEHFPDYGEYTWMRVLARSVSQLITEDAYQLKLTLSPPIPAPADVDTGLYGILYQPHHASEDSRAYFGSTGDAPAPGYPAVPTVGLIEVVTDPPPSLGGNYPNVGFRMLGDGTLDRVRFTCDAAYVGTGVTGVDFAILLNGSPIEVTHVANTGGLTYYTAGPVTVEVTSLSVSTNDVISASVAKSGQIGPWVVPSGAGNLSFGLEISGGTLA